MTLKDLEDITNDYYSGDQDRIEGGPPEKEYEMWEDAMDKTLEKRAAEFNRVTLEERRLLDSQNSTRVVVAAIATSGNRLMDTILTELRAVIDERAEIAKRDKELAKRRKEIEGEIRRHCEQNGIESVSKAGVLSVKVKEEMVARVDPEKWDEAFKWGVEHGVLMRKVKSAMIVEMALANKELPAFISIESYPKVSARRA